MSKVLSMRLREEQMARLQRLARRMNRTPSETAALLLEESLREAEFAYIQFRDSAAGRQAYILGSGMAVWEFVMVARHYAENAVEQTAALLELPLVMVQAALNYAEAYPEEIAAALADNDKGYEELKRMLPGAGLFEFHDVAEGGDRSEAERRDVVS